MSRKSRGIDAERELLHMLWDEGWGAMRVAGSGAMKYPSADVVAGNGFRRIVMECKKSKNGRKYISKDQIEELKILSKKFAAEPWIAVRFPQKIWEFFMLEDLDEKKKSFAINREKSITFKQVIDNYDF